MTNFEMNNLNENHLNENINMNNNGFADNLKGRAKR